MVHQKFAMVLGSADGHSARRMTAEPTARRRRNPTPMPGAASSTRWLPICSGAAALLHEGGRAYPVGRSRGPSHRLVGADRRRAAAPDGAHRRHQEGAAHAAHAGHGGADGGADHRQLGHLCLGDRQRPHAGDRARLLHQPAVQRVPRRGGARREARPAQMRRDRAGRRRRRAADRRDRRAALGVAGAVRYPGPSTRCSGRRCRSARRRASSSKC